MIILAKRPKDHKNAVIATVNFVTTVMADYKPHEIYKREPSFKPIHKYIAPEAKFDGKTTQSSAFKPWPTEIRQKPTWAKKPVYVPTKLNYTKTSSYQVLIPQ